MITTETPLLRVRAAGFDWAVPVTVVERVDRLEDAELEVEGGKPYLRSRDFGDREENEAPGEALVTLEPWSEIEDSLSGRRLLRLRRKDSSVPLVVDEITGQTPPDGGVFSLPPLPFQEPPPVSQIAVSQSDLIPLLDLEKLTEENGPGAASKAEPAEAPTTAQPQTPGPFADAEPELILLPALEDGESSSLIPALSAAQVLSVEPSDRILPLPGLPSWCLGLVWWQGRPIPLFDLSARLVRAASTPTAEQHAGDRHAAGRQVVVAVPGGDVAALTLNGTCRPLAMPERALSIPASSPLGDGIHALFEVEDFRLAILDLKRWCYPTSSIGQYP